MRATFTLLCVLIFNFAFSQECNLLISSGGGITGVATVYKIDKDGNVLKGNGLGDIKFSEQSKVKKSIARQLYRKARHAIGTTSFNHPGNMYYSIATIEDGKETRITWGDSQFPVQQPHKDLYQEITKVLTALTFTPATTK